MLTTVLIGFSIMVGIALALVGIVTFISFTEDYRCRCYKDYVKKWHKETRVTQAFVVLGVLIALGLCLFLVFIFSLLLGLVVTGGIQ